MTPNGARPEPPVPLAVLNSIAGAVLVVDAPLHILFANGAAEQLHRHRPFGRTIGGHFADFPRMTLPHRRTGDHFGNDQMRTMTSHLPAHR